MRWVRKRGTTSFLCFSCTLWSNTFTFRSWGDHKVGPLDSVAYLRHITLRYSVRREKLTRRHSSWNVNLILPWGCCSIWIYPQICERTNGFTDKQSTWISVVKNPSPLSLTWHQCYNHLMHIIGVEVFCSYWQVGSVVCVTRGSAFWIDWLQPKATKRKTIQKHKYTWTWPWKFTSCKDMTTVIEINHCWFKKENCMRLKTTCSCRWLAWL